MKNFKITTGIIAALLLNVFIVNAQMHTSELSQSFNSTWYLRNISNFGYDYREQEASNNEKIFFTVYLEYFEVEAEPKLEIEDWMLNDILFFDLSFFLEEEMEEPLKLENWMIHDKYFYQSKIDFEMLLEKEQDEKLELENWMLDNKIWKNN